MNKFRLTISLEGTEGTILGITLYRDELNGIIEDAVNHLRLEHIPEPEPVKPGPSQHTLAAFKQQRDSNLTKKLDDELGGL